jgi:hypothetical protein
MMSFLKAHRSLMLLAVVGIGLTVGLWQFARLSDVPRLERSRGEIAAIAEQYARARGFAPENFMTFVEPKSTFFQEERGGLIAWLNEKFSIPDLREWLKRRGETVALWEASWVRDVPKNAPQEIMRIYVDYGGTVRGFTHQLHDTTKLPFASLEKAQQLAKDFLQKEHQIAVSDTLTWREKNVRTDEKPAFSTHRFTWQKTNREFADLAEEVEVGVSGSVVTSYVSRLIVPPAYKEKFTNEFAASRFFLFLPNLISFLLLIVLGGFFLKKYHDGEVGVRGGAAVFVIVLIGGVLTYLNSAQSFAQNSDFSFTRSVNLILFALFGIIFGYLSFAVIAFFAWTIGESDARAMQNQKMLLALDSLFQKQIFTKPVGRELLIGLMLASVITGGETLYIFFCETVVGGWNNSVGSAPLQSRSIPAFAGIFGLPMALASTIVLRLFLYQRVMKLVPNQWVAFAVTGVASAFFYRDSIPVYPYWLDIICGIAVGIVVNWAAVRYGLLAATIGLFSNELFFELPPLLLSGNATNVLVGCSELAILGAFFFVGIAALRGHEFEFKGSTLPTHIERISQRVRMQEELKIARDTQLRLLPQSDPKVNGLDISGICLPALEVGGDYYDYMQLDENRFAIAIGDVSGKGVPAAMYMTLVKGMMQVASSTLSTPKEILIETNRLVYKTIKRGTFISMIYAVIDLDKKTLVYARAGHNPLLVVTRDRNASIAPMPKGMALGLGDSDVFASRIEETTVDLKSGDTLVFYTDGFSEAKNSDNDEYSEARLLATLQKHSEKMTSREIVRAIVKEVHAFTGIAPQHDDMTMVVLKVR